MHEYLSFCSFKYKFWVLGFCNLLAALFGAFAGFFVKIANDFGEESPTEDYTLLLYGLSFLFFGIFLMELLADMDIFECFIGKKASSFDFIGGSPKWEQVIRAVISGNIKRRFLTALIAGISFGAMTKGIAFLTDSFFPLLVFAIFTIGSLELILSRAITMVMLRLFIFILCTIIAELLTFVAMIIDRPFLTALIILALAFSGIGFSIFEVRSMIRKGHNYYFD